MATMPWSPGPFAHHSHPHLHSIRHNLSGTQVFLSHARTIVPPTLFAVVPLHTLHTSPPSSPIKQRVPPAPIPPPPAPLPVPVSLPPTLPAKRRFPPPPVHHERQRSIPDLREALYSIDSKMAALVKERAELESHLEQVVRMQSPVLRLPSELLSNIFTIGAGMAGPPSWEAPDEENLDVVMVSTLLLVCRYWNEVAINTPQLWSRISVSTHDGLDKVCRKLSRSRSAPLDITINFSPRGVDLSGASGGVTETVIHAMDLIRPSLWRTRSFRLSVPNRAQAHAALTRCQEDAPLLQFLSIRIFHSIQEDHYATPPLPLFNGHTPQLRSCSFTSFNFGWDVSVASNLRVLKLGGYFNGFSPCPNALIEILRLCPTLEELALRNMSDVDSPDSSCTGEEIFDVPKVKVPLLRLTKASFYYSGITRTRILLGQISFPALESLEFCYLDNLTPVLTHLKTQSLTSLPLKVLRIESSFFSELEFAKLLRRLSSLTTLELVDVEDASSNFLRGLSAPAWGENWITPKLDTLNLDGCTNLDWDSLRSLVKSRLPHQPHNYPQQPSRTPARSRSYPMSTASASAGRTFKSPPPEKPVAPVIAGPVRLRSIDVTRCHQISKEMVQWLRIYVADVKCEPGKGVWGEAVMP